MAIDPNAPPRSEATFGASAIENELPSYRAVSALAVVSLLLGLASLLSFVDPWFLLAGVGAIVTGALSLLKIRKYSDVLTGTPFAQAGIVLGLMFGLSSTTIRQVDLFLLSRKADQFADKYVRVLQEEGLAEAVWSRLSPSEQVGRSPKQYLSTLKGGGRDAQMEYRNATSARSSGCAPGFRRGPSCTASGSRPAAMTASSRMQPSCSNWTDQAVAKAPARPTTCCWNSGARSRVGDISWFVSELRNDYARRSYALKHKVVDDGHGHSHEH